MSCCAYCPSVDATHAVSRVPMLQYAAVRSLSGDSSGKCKILNIVCQSCSDHAVSVCVKVWNIRCHHDFTTELNFTNEENHYMAAWALTCSPGLGSTHFSRGKHMAVCACQCSCERHLEYSCELAA